MELEEYWGVGPKTRATLEGSIGTEAAIAAIESGDDRTLVDAGLEPSRATQVLRRAQSAQGMDMLATRDARSVYRDIIELAAEHAVNREAAGRIRTLTPLTDLDRIAERQDAVERAREMWDGLDDGKREAVLEAFEAYDDVGGGELAAVETAVAIQETSASGPAFEPILQLDGEALEDAAIALRALRDGTVGTGADEELERLREAREAVDTMSANASSLVEGFRSNDVRDTAAFQEALVEHLRSETAIDSARIRETMATEAVDATGFVDETLRPLRRSLDEAVDERAAEVRADLEGDVEAARKDVERTRTAVAEVARDLSLGRFADAYDLRRPSFVDGDALAVADARNLSLVDGGEAVQPVSYAIGNHDLERAQLSPCDRVVFHRRHASFNAGVLESTLQSVVPPLVSGDRTLMLVDEFEAITEPGRAADLLHGLVQLTVDEGALGTFVTHLADDLAPLPEPARTDGIFAKGLTSDLQLEVDYQPRFGEVGRSTPEFIVSRLVANANDRAEEAGFRTLARSIDTEVVQRTLSDAAWGGVEGE